MRQKRLETLLPADHYIVERIEGFKYNNGQLHFVVKWANYPSSMNSDEPLENVRHCIAYHHYIENLYNHVLPDITINNIQMENKLGDQIITTLNTQPKSFIMGLIDSLDFDEFNAHRVLFHFTEKNGMNDFYKRYDELFYKHHFKELLDEQSKCFDEMLLGIRMKEIMTVTMTNDINFSTPSHFQYITKNLLPISWNEGNEIQCSFVKTDSLALESEACFNLNSLLEIKQSLDVFYTGEERGWGLRTTAKIDQGVVIEECIGELIEENTARAYDNKSFFFPVQLSNSNERFTIDATNNGNLARFINHSCSPNSRFLLTCNCNGPLQHKKLVIFALEDIEKGDEITVDYTLGSYEETQGITCHCGAHDCAGYF